MADTYEVWLDQVKDALRSINMRMEDWQKIWAFDFAAEHKRGTDPDVAAMRANRFWWREQNKSLKKECPETRGCWLPSGHKGECQPVFRALGSASDQSRLVAAYSRALAAASEQMGGQHPGFVILDEPLQQNPDEKHRELFLNFLTKECWRKAELSLRLQSRNVSVIEGISSQGGTLRVPGK